MCCSERTGDVRCRSLTSARLTGEPEWKHTYTWYCLHLESLQSPKAWRPTEEKGTWDERSVVRGVISDADRRDRLSDARCRRGDWSGVNKAPTAAGQKE